MDADAVQDRWRARRAPDADVVVLADGSLHVMSLTSLHGGGGGPPAIWHHLLTARSWEPAGWLEIDTENGACVANDRRAIVGEASAHGSIGWVALTRAADDRLEWLAVSCSSNPFIRVALSDTDAIAATTAGTVWHIPLDAPHRTRIV